jgi:hypothetical protein
MMEEISIEELKKKSQEDRIAVLGKVAANKAVLTIDEAPVFTENQDAISRDHEVNN